MNGDYKVFKHPYLFSCGGEKALPVAEEAYLHKLSNKQFIDQALEQLEHSTRHNCCHSLREDNVSTMLEASLTNGNLLCYGTLTLLKNDSSVVQLALMKHYCCNFSYTVL